MQELAAAEQGRAAHLKNELALATASLEEEREETRKLRQLLDEACAEKDKALLELEAMRKEADAAREDVDAARKELDAAREKVLPDAAALASPPIGFGLAPPPLTPPPLLAPPPLAPPQLAPPPLAPPPIPASVSGQPPPPRLLLDLNELRDVLMLETGL